MSMQEKSPEVSIILTTYNRPAMLRRAVESVVAQTFTDWELLIFDDNSDNPEQVSYLDELRKIERVHVVVSDVREEDRLKTARYATLINDALAIARGKYITYLCDDDYFMPTRLEKMVSFLEASLDKHVVYGSQGTIYIQPDGTETEGSIRAATAILENADCVVDHSSVMHTWEAYNKVGGWDDDPTNWGHADGIFWKKLGEGGYLFHPINEVLDFHVYHDGSWTKKVGETHHARNV